MLVLGARAGCLCWLLPSSALIKPAQPVSCVLAAMCSQTRDLPTNLRTSCKFFSDVRLDYSIHSLTLKYIVLCFILLDCVYSLGLCLILVSNSASLCFTSSLCRIRSVLFSSNSCFSLSLGCDQHCVVVVAGPIHEPRANRAIPRTHTAGSAHALDLQFSSEVNQCQASNNQMNQKDSKRCVESISVRL